MTLRRPSPVFLTSSVHSFLCVLRAFAVIPPGGNPPPPEIIAAEWLSSHAEYGEDQGECGPTDADSDTDPHAYSETGIAQWQIPAADLQRQLDWIAEAHDLLDAGELPANLDPAELDPRARRLMEAGTGSPFLSANESSSSMAAELKGGPPDR